jgi:hypothetical protein
MADDSPPEKKAVAKARAGYEPYMPKSRGQGVAESAQRTEGKKVKKKNSGLEPRQKTRAQAVEEKAVESIARAEVMFKLMNRHRQSTQEPAPQAPQQAQVIRQNHSTKHQSQQAWQQPPARQLPAATRQTQTQQPAQSKQPVRVRQPPPQSTPPPPAAAEFGGKGGAATYNNFSASGLAADELYAIAKGWEVQLKSLVKERARRGVSKCRPEEEAIRKGLREAYGGMLVDHYSFASTAGIDSKLWSTFYRPVQVLRGDLKQQKQQSSSKSEASKQMFVLLATSERFYKSLVQKLAQKYAKHLLEAQQSKSGARMPPNEQESLRVIFQNSFLALGDVARYAQLYSAKSSEEKEWGQAEKYYKQSLHIRPSNGRCHNQLAVLAAYNSKDSAKENQSGTMRFVAAYFYMRSLACLEPFPAKEGLLTLLAKIDKQVRSLRSPPSASSTDFKSLRMRFGLRVAAAVGTCFSRVDLDSFDAQHQSAIPELRALLAAYAQQKRQWHEVGLAAKMQGPEDKALHVFLVRVMALCIFVLPTRAKYATVADVSACEIASCAFAFAIDVGAEICASAYQHIELLCPCLGALNVLFGWLQQHPPFLQPPYIPSMERLRLALVPLLSGLSNFLPPNTSSQQRNELASNSWLSEDQELQGFEPNGEALSRQGRAAPITPVTSPPPAITDVTDLNLPIRAVRTVVFGEHAAAFGLIFRHADSGRFALDPFREDHASDGGPAMGSAADATPNHSLTPAATPATQDPMPSGDTMAMDAMSMVRGLLTGVDLSITSPSVTSPTKDTDGVDSGHVDSGRAHGQGQRSDHGQMQGYGRTRSSPPRAPKTKSKALVVLDAPNLAMAHGMHKTFSCAGIKIALAYYMQRGHRVVAFLPSFLTDFESVGKAKRASNAGYDMKTKCPDDVKMLQQLVAERLVIETPDSDYDDSYCIKYAQKTK